MIWIAYELIPEIIHDNAKNINNINKILEKFNMNLLEYLYLNKGTKGFGSYFGMNKTY
jgi:hypothetical protein